MSYDPNLDRKLFDTYWQKNDGRIRVAIYSYDNGVKRIQIHRERQSIDGEWRFSYLGRLTKEEVENLLPLLKAAVEKMDDGE